MLVGLADSVAVGLGAAGAATTTSNHPPQLFPSYDSSIFPESLLFLLSAQARAEYVPAAGKVYDCDVVLEAPAAKVFMLLELRPVIVPPPFVAVAIWMKVSKGDVFAACSSPASTPQHQDRDCP